MIIDIPMLISAIILTAMAFGLFSWDAHVTKKVEREAGCYGETKEEDTQM